MTPTPSVAKKKAFGELLLSYYTAQKKFQTQIFHGECSVMGLQMFSEKCMSCTTSH
jgi:hypothetical protein